MVSPATMIKFNCPHCQQSLRVPVSRADTEAVCPGCHAQLRVPPAVVAESSEALLAPPVVTSAAETTDAEESVIQARDTETPDSQSDTVPESEIIASVNSPAAEVDSLDPSSLEQHTSSDSAEQPSADMDESSDDSREEADDDRTKAPQSDILKDRRRRVDHGRGADRSHDGGHLQGTNRPAER